MPWFQKPIEKGLDIIDQMVDDGDLAIKLKYELYQSELATKTHPIIDGIHKLGRQMLALVQVGFYAWAVKAGVEITPELVAGVSGATGIYAAIKGKGN